MYVQPILIIVSGADMSQTMKIICKDRRRKTAAGLREGRGVSSVSADVDRLLGPKSYEELEVLEKQIRKKLDSNEPIDFDYWEHLLRSLKVWKARARLRRVSQTIINSRVEILRKQQQEEALSVQGKLQDILGKHLQNIDPATITYSNALDPEPSLKLRPEDKGLSSIDEKEFLSNIVSATHALVLFVG